METILTLARQLELEVTAEGVETATQLTRLRALQSEYAQGYFLSCCRWGSSNSLTESKSAMVKS
ncbi:MAG: hypothetical protein CLLPBCKN_003870 [Chroococcidiopsis cubana SAG 39.79]|nr:hypothetical protein [Chroococcidiopsis cubana SAG 39.79]